MKIIDRYITREFIKLFFLVLASFTIIYLIVDFFGRIRMFLSNDATARQIFLHFGFGIPQIISHTIPVAVLLATLITFSILSRNSEIVAMRANGISIYRMTLPVLILGILISVMGFFFNEFVTPMANHKAKYIEFVEVKKQRRMGAFSQNQIWYRSRNAIYNFALFVPEKNVLKGVTIHHFDQGFNLVMRVDAKEASWTPNGWILSKVMVTRFPPGDFPVVERHDSLPADIPEKPSDLQAVQKGADEMSFFELRSFINKLRSEGYDATRYLVDLHGKIAFTLVSVILVVLGVSFSLRSERSGGVALSIGAGIIIGFSYWIVFALSISLGRSLTLPPFFAAWSANFLFALASAALYLRVRT
ncbi:MAG: LPS export ABC transporter permease LptG [Syntrophales bacterium]|nr:LPS export ABC transporter permease LptG [Syntrophales bacterium]MDD5232733.1 LPS export ABC transporter permease LptG [Syntrophales bacterium]MDD5531583.1 LPS export ABC transporter permease LptG [Syntrophales bacterium]HPL63171.1 LPS export ABC transporter permease LptG [Syntrophales bacterium]